jgi:hypothetical protein
MKKVVLVSLLFFAVLAVQAQVTFKPGVRLGANFSQITNTELGSRTDFYIGGFGALKLSKFYTLQPEITYSRQGGEGDVRVYDNNTGDYTNQNLDVKLQYLSFCALSKFTFNDSFNVHLGPTFDIITNSDRYTYNDVDLGVTLGLGYTLPFGLGIEARVKKGLIEAVDTYSYNYDNSYYYDGNTGTNLVFSLGLSYSFEVTGSSK